MKRPILHIIFWVVYLIQDTLLHYSWMRPTINNVTEIEQVWMAVKTAFAVLPPKLFIVYYFTNYGVKKLLSDKKNWVFIVGEMFFLLFISVLWFRITFHYFVNPQIYHVKVNVPLYNIRNLLITVLEIGYITGIAIAFKLLRLQASSKIREQNLVKEKLQTELKFLRNQTNPHFLFNTLNNIYGLARRKSDKTAGVVMKLSELLSFMLYESKKETIAISEEIKILQDYIALEKIRYGDRLSVNFNQQIDCGSQSIAPLLLLPLVENAFKHGVSESRFGSFINIDIVLKGRQLKFFIENTIENGKLKPLNGNIGLTSLERQLELMYKEYELEVDNKGKTFIVNISINLDSYGKI